MELKPTNFKERKPDQFGQTYNADPDLSKWSGESPQDTRRAHVRSDVDLSPRSLHHTLGPRRNQASPGDHIHDGVTSKKLGPMEMDPSNPGKTRPKWALPSNPSVADVVNLLSQFVNFRRV